MDDYRPRAEYTNNFGPLQFDNPDPSGPLKAVSYCIVDHMIHIFLNHDPIPGKGDYQELISQVQESTRKVTGHTPMRSGGRVSGLGCDGYIAIWDPGEADLEDMVRIVEGIPELQAGWAREALEKLKHEAGLAREDFPYIDSYANEQKGSLSHGWFSAKGGTLYFRNKTPASVLENVKSALRAQGAEVTDAEPLRSEHSHDMRRLFPNMAPPPPMPAVRFMWHTPQENIQASLDKMTVAMEGLRGVLTPSGRRPGRSDTVHSR